MRIVTAIIFATFLAIDASAAGTGCSDTSGALPLEKIRANATGTQLLGCLNRSFETLSSSVAVSSPGASGVMDNLTVRQIKGLSGGIEISSSVTLTGTSSMTILGAGEVLGGFHASTTPTAGYGLYVAADGKVGVRTAAPASGDLELTPRGSDTGGLYVLESDGGNAAARIQASATRGYFDLLSAGIPKVSLTAGTGDNYFNGGGNVGIGTTNPGAQLAVGNTETASGVQFLFKTSSTAVDLYNEGGTYERSMLRFYTNDTSRWRIGTNENQTYAYSQAPSFNFQEGTTDRLTLAPGGNVGIGTMFPATKVHVSSGYITFDGTNSALTIGKNSPATPLSIFNTRGDSAAFSVWINRVASNTGERPYISLDRSSGTLTTPLILDADDAGEDLGLISARGYDGASYIDGAAIVFELDGAPGTNDMPGRLVFKTTADGAATPTERMRITNSGNVGIGTTNPTSKLLVSGNMQVGENGYNDGRTDWYTNAGVNSARIGGAGYNSWVNNGGGNFGVGTPTPASALQLGALADGTTLYLQIDSENGTPPAADCDAAAESGRMIVDYANDRLYICNEKHTGRGWDYIGLTD